MKKTLLLLLVVICILPAIFSLFRSGFFVTDDGNSMIIRFTAFYDALRHGQFPVRFLPRLNFGYGYPVSNFLYPLFLYIGIPIRVLGFTFVNTIKIILGISLLLSGICSFLWYRKRFSTVAALVGATAYALYPYHLWDMYKRGSVGEVLGLAIVPFILWQIERKSIAFAGIGLGLLILAHNVLALLFIPIIGVYIIFSNKFTVKEQIMVFVIGLGSSAFFWIPAITDRKYTIFDKTVISDFSHYFLQRNDYYLIGLVSVVALGIGFLTFLKNSKRINWIFYGCTLFSLFLTLPIAKGVWQIIPGTYFIQFPFRLLSLSALCVSFIIAAAIDCFHGKYLWAISTIFMMVIYFSSADLLQPKNLQIYPDSYYSTNVDSTTIKNEYMPVWVHSSPSNIPNEKVFLSTGIGTVRDVVSNGTEIHFTASVLQQSTVQVNIIYFPGWVAYVDGKQQKISYDNSHGTIQFPLSAGVHSIVVRFIETSDRLISDILSLVSFFTAVVICIWERKKKNIE